MKNRKGFALSGIIYSLLILFLVLVLNSLNNLQNKKQILDQLKLDTVNAIDQPWQVELANLDKRINQLQEELNNTKQNVTPPGEIISYMGNNPPTGYLFCDGTVYNIADYPKLAEQIKKEFGSYQYFGGNGVTTFAVPNLQGEFLRGYTKNSDKSVTTGVKTSLVGKNQLATTHAMDGTYLGASGTDMWQGGFVGTSGIATDTLGRRYADTTDGSSIGFLVNRGTLDSNASFINKPTVYTSRPTNTSVLYCIKY